MGNGGNSHTRFRELDVLRGFAALAVVVYHYSRHGTRYFDDYPFVFLDGHYGVQLFFVISGFVIYFTLQRSRTLLDFVFSRFSRLYPAYWVAIAITLVYGLLVLHTQPWWPGYAANLTMLQEFAGFGNLDAVFWTLGVELVFYAVMALAFSLRLLRQIVPLCIIWLLAAVIWSRVTHFDGATFTSVQQSLLILPSAPYFVAGIMFYLCSSRGVQRQFVGMIVFAWLTILIVAGFPDALVAAMIFGTVGLAIAGRLAFLVSSGTLWLGAISYPLYLTHRNLGYRLLFWFNGHHVPHLVALTLTVLAAFLLAWAVSVSVERPAMRALRAWYRKVRSPAVAALPR